MMKSKKIVVFLVILMVFAWVCGNILAKQAIANPDSYWSAKAVKIDGDITSFRVEFSDSFFKGDEQKAIYLTLYKVPDQIFKNPSKTWKNMRIVFLGYASKKNLMINEDVYELGSLQNYTWMMTFDDNQFSEDNLSLGKIIIDRFMTQAVLGEEASRSRKLDFWCSIPSDNDFPRFCLNFNVIGMSNKNLATLTVSIRTDKGEKVVLEKNPIEINDIGEYKVYMNIPSRGKCDIITELISQGESVVRSGYFSLP